MTQYLALILALIGACELIAAPPLFVVTNSKGAGEQATIISWDAGAKPVFRRLMDSKESSFDFLYLNQQSTDIPRIPDDNLMWLENGDCLKFEKIRVVDDQLHLLCGSIRGEAAEQITLPILELRMVWWRNPRRELSPAQLRRQYLQKRLTKDQLVLANGEKVEGIFETLDQGKLDIDTGEIKSTLKTEQLAFLVLGNEKPPGVKTMTDSCRITTTAGDRITLSKVRLKDAMLAGEMSSGNQVRMPIEKVAKVVNASTNVVSLLNHDFISLEKNRWFSGAKSVVKPRISIGEEIFTSAGVMDDGLILDGNSELKIGRIGKYKSLVMTLGVDAASHAMVVPRLAFTSGGKTIHTPLEIDANENKTILLGLDRFQEIVITQQAVPGVRVVISDAFFIP